MGAAPGSPRGCSDGSGQMPEATSHGSMGSQRLPALGSSDSVAGSPGFGYDRASGVSQTLHRELPLRILARGLCEEAHNARGGSPDSPAVHRHGNDGDNLETILQEAIDKITAKISDLVQEVHQDFLSECGTKIRSLEHRMLSSEHNMCVDNGKREERDREILSWIHGVNEEVANVKKQITDVRWDGRRLERLEKMFQESELRKAADVRDYMRLSERVEDPSTGHRVSAMSRQCLFSSSRSSAVDTLPSSELVNTVTRDPRAAEALAASAAEELCSAVHTWQRRRQRQNESALHNFGAIGASGVGRPSDLATWRSDVASDKSTAATEEFEEAERIHCQGGALTPSTVEGRRYHNSLPEMVNHGMDSLQQVLRSVGKEVVTVSITLAKHEARLEAMDQALQDNRQEIGVERCLREVALQKEQQEHRILVEAWAREKEGTERKLDGVVRRLTHLEADMKTSGAGGAGDRGSTWPCCRTCRKRHASPALGGRPVSGSIAIGTVAPAPSDCVDKLASQQPLCESILCPQPYGRPTAGEGTHVPKAHDVDEEALTLSSGSQGACLQASGDECRQ